MTNWERLLFQKKAEFWVRLSQAALTLRPAENAPLLDRIIYRNLAKLGNRLFLRFAYEEVARERMKMAQEDCKHDMAGAEATFCPGCGKQLGADPEVENVVGRVVRKILQEYDVKPKATPKGRKETPKSLAEKLGIGEKK